MDVAKEKIFHLGLCMAGSVTAGAYTAGVLDYLIEALEKWQEQKGKDPSLPDHQVVIDLLSGTSGGGMNAAMTNFALRDTLEHGELKVIDGKNVFKPTLNNVLWKSWVELRDTDKNPLLAALLDTSDIDNHHYVASGLNSKFIDEIAEDFSDYITKLAAAHTVQPGYLCPENEICMMVFNVTGIRYKLLTKATAGGEQFAMQHRDLGHFRWQKTYLAPTSEKTDPRGIPDGRIEIHFSNLSNQSILIDAAKATGAFPAGLKPRLLRRPAKYIWDHPFFKKGNRFNKSSIYLGESVNLETDIYTSINADGGTANNEPVELCRELLYEMRLRYYKDLVAPTGDDETITRREEVLQTLDNSSVILIDPFPSVSGEVDKPITGKGRANTDNFTSYAGDLIDAMRSTLLIDAKLTMDAYKKENYGLHLIAPSHSTKSPENAIACGSLSGFGGFLSKEFRINDFFLGRRNAQSFLRQYFVVNLDEPDTAKNNENYKCIRAVIKGYENNPAARQRFEFKGKDGKKWAPIIPDVTLTSPFDVNKPQSQLPEYILKPLASNALDDFRPDIKDRIKAIIDNIIEGQGFFKTIAKILTSGRLTDKVLETIARDLKKRDLMK